MGEKYDKIISPFLVCLGRLREVTMDDKRQRVARMRQSTLATMDDKRERVAKMQQSTLHDAWNT